MLKIDSVTMSFRALAGASFSRLSRCSMSQWRYTATAARESRQPSMMLAWFNWSLRTKSSFSTSVAMIPTLAWYPLLNTSAASVPLKRAMRRSSSSCAVMLPEISRDAPEPQP